MGYQIKIVLPLSDLEHIDISTLKYTADWFSTIKGPTQFKDFNILSANLNTVLLTPIEPVSEFPHLKCMLTNRLDV